jgi:hypothetical protein
MRCDQIKFSGWNIFIVLQCKLERFCKNEYDRDSYSLFSSFRSQPALISCLANRASLNAIDAATPSSPIYDGGAGLYQRTCQDCKKKLARIKLLVNSACGKKTPSIIQTNCIIKTVKDKNITKMTKRIPDVVVADAAAI